MRKFLLLPAFAALALISGAQAQQDERNQLEIATLRPIIQPIYTQPVHHAASSGNKNKHLHQTGLLKDLSAGVKLNSQRIGSAGNMLTVLEFNCEQLDVDSLLNTVTFIHRVDNIVQPTSNIAQYDYDMSQNGGLTWKSNLGPIDDTSIIDNIHVNGRYPQAVIFNPPGNTISDSAYLIYDGTWHNVPVNGTDGSWVGEIRGRGNLNTSNSSSFNWHIDSVNHGITSIGTGMHQSVPGVFWNINLDFTGTFLPNSNQFARGIVVEKGVWNPVTRDVDWDSSEIHQGFDSLTVNNGTNDIIESVAGSFVIAFDPSGQYGWISCLGDITSNPTGDSVYHPIFWKSVDSGATWTGPIQVNTDSLPGVVEQQASYIPEAVPGTNTGVMYEANLTVDYLGNPHLFCTIGLASGYIEYYPNAGFSAYDITYNPHPGACDSTWNGWQAVFVDSVGTVQGTYSTDNPPITEDNRPLVSRSADGTKLFFYWLDSDKDYESEYTTDSSANDNPNLFTRAFDVAHHTATPTINLTYGDTLWGGATLAGTNAGIAPGIFNGANFPVIAPLALQVGNNYNVPLVLTELDYPNFGALGSDNEGAAFWYINNITYAPYDFSISTSASATITVLGEDTIVVRTGSSYVDSGATYTISTSCYNPGNVFLVTDSSQVNVNAQGDYTIYYAVEDSSGNVYASATRTVIVESPPQAEFVWLVLENYNVQFTDHSLYNPTSWSWTFGDPTSPSNASNQKDPSHTYSASGTYLVCLSVANDVGSASFGTLCDSVPVAFISGIVQVKNFVQDVTLYPNPSSGKVNITLNGSVMPDFNVTVYDVLGEQIAGATEYKAGTANVEMDLSNLSSGVYMVRIQSGSSSSVKRLVLTGKQ